MNSLDKMEDYDRLKQERDELAAQVEVMRDALRGCAGWVEAYGEMEAKDIVRAALSITPSAALREIQARTLEQAGLKLLVNGSGAAHAFLMMEAQQIRAQMK